VSPQHPHIHLQSSPEDIPFLSVVPCIIVKSPHSDCFFATDTFIVQWRQVIAVVAQRDECSDGVWCCRHFVSSIDVTGLPVDIALRKFQSQFRLPVRLIMYLLLSLQSNAPSIRSLVADEETMLLVALCDKKAVVRVESVVDRSELPEG